MFTADIFVSMVLIKRDTLKVSEGPINLFDTFLHSQDRAYTVDQIYKFVEDAGLQLRVHNFNPSLDQNVVTGPI